MDGSRKVMENFNSLWFFNNVLTLTTPLHHKSSSLNEDTVEDEKKPSETAEILVPVCPNCGEIAVGIEPVKDQYSAEIAKPPEKQERKKRGRRRRKKRSKRKILGELDLGTFYGNCLDSESSFSEETFGYQKFESRHNYTMKMPPLNGGSAMKMPPLNDGSAMKEHLKSWAYAVACTVR